MDRRASYFNPWPALLVTLVLTALYGLFFAAVVWPYLGYGSFLTAWRTDFSWLQPYPDQRLALLLLFAGGWLLVTGPVLAAFPLWHRRFRILRGLEYLADHRGAARAARRLGAGSHGFALHPTLRLASLENGLLLTGGRGSGKTQVLMRVLCDLIDQPPPDRRQRRIIVFDFKGDYTRYLPTEDFILVAPWHGQGWWWDLSQDIISLSRARLMAQYFIKESRGLDSVWAKGARQLFSALMNHLIQAGEAVTFHRLVEFCRLPDAEFVQVARAGNPAEIQRTLGELTESGHFNRTAQSFIANMSAEFAPVTDLAFAWQHADPQRRFSISEFLADDWDGPEILILQGSSEYAGLAQSLNATLLSFLASMVTSGRFPEVADRDHPYDLYLFLDEVVRLGKVPPIEDLISVGRSKGIRPLVGFQDIGQVIDLYGEHLAKTWASQFGAYYIGRSGLGETAYWVAERVLGKQEIEYVASSASFSGGQLTDSRSLQRREQPVVMPHELSSDLYVNEKARAFYGLFHVTGQQQVLRLRWPIVEYPLRRPAVVPNLALERSDFSQL